MDDVKQRVERLETVNRKIFAILARIEGSIADNMFTKGEAAALENRINKRFDAVTGRSEDLRFRYAVHADTLLQHDRRIAKLEKRGS